MSLLKSIALQAPIVMLESSSARPANATAENLNQNWNNISKQRNPQKKGGGIEKPRNSLGPMLQIQ